MNHEINKNDDIPRLRFITAGQAGPDIDGIGQSETPSSLHYDGHGEVSHRYVGMV
ncbi:MAG TPA: hypothetical protein VI583_06140 [Cyclobacteriaceae bacterium]|nr:hypothetical protein [Cyclobacteriaceae bacterium]